MKIDKSKKILLDADVIIHFIKGNQTGLLNKIFKNNLFILDVVFSEVFRGSLRTTVENLIKFSIIEEIEFNNASTEIKREYFALIKTRGKGESACMAWCRYNKDILASSNLIDIHHYCTLHEIQYLTTMDFVKEAYNNKLMTESECDEFIYNVKSKGSKLPVSTIKEYTRKN